MASRPVQVGIMMKYTFKYETTAYDIWQLSMLSLYGSMAGVCNIIFTVAMVLLTGRFWVEVNAFFKGLLIMGITVFTVIQPTLVYWRAKKQAATIPLVMEIGFDDHGIHVKTDEQSSDLKWNAIKGISKKPTMIVIFSTNQHGFILTNKVLGEHKAAFYDYVCSKIRK